MNFAKGMTMRILTLAGNVGLIGLFAGIFLMKNNQPARGQEVKVQAAPNAAIRGAVVGGYALSAQIESAKIQSADPVVLRVVIKNMTQGKLSYIETRAELVFDLVVKNGKREVMPLTKFGKQVFQPPAGKIMTRLIKVNLEAGEERRYRLPLNALYDMTIPDTYTVIVKKAVEAKGGGIAEVTSNVAIVKVEGFDASEPPNPIEGEDSRDGK